MRASAVLLALSVLGTSVAACDAKSPPKGSTAANESVDQVKSLLRGELSAVSTYEAALQKNDTHAWAPALNRILEGHRDAVDRLKGRVTDLGGTPDSSAGLWGGWADLVAKTAAVLGDEPARQALKAGENHGIKEYEDALASAKVDDKTKSLITDTLLPRAREHVTALDALKK